MTPRSSARRSASTLAVVLALVLAGCGDDGDADVSPDPDPVEDTGAPDGEDANDVSQDDEPSVTITPSTGLSGGDTVRIEGRDFPPGLGLGITQCADANDPVHGIDETTADHCYLEGIVPVDADDDGNVEAEFTVSGGPFGRAEIVCADGNRCTVAVGELSPDPDAVRAVQSLTFDG